MNNASGNGRNLTNSQRRALTRELAQQLTFGVEIETKGLTRQAAVAVVAEITGGTVRGAGWHGNNYRCELADGRSWKAVTDASVHGGCEVVSPILRWSDIETMQEIVRGLRRAGARVDSDCGIHVHIGAERFDAKHLGNLVKLVYRHEPNLRYALYGATSNARDSWCRELPSSFVQRLADRRPEDLTELGRLWYGGDPRYHANNHYDGSRYRGLNLHALWYHGTVEFRWFDAVLHAGKVKAYVQMCCHLAARALTLNQTSWKRADFDEAKTKWRIRTMMLDLGMSGAEYKTARLHWTSKCKGDGSAANGQRRQAQAAPAAPAPTYRDGARTTMTADEAAAEYGVARNLQRGDTTAGGNGRFVGVSPTGTVWTCWTSMGFEAMCDRFDHNYRTQAAA